MPQVPISQGRTVQDSPLQGGFQQAPDVGAPARALSAGLLDAASAADRIAERDVQRKAYDTQVAVQSQWLAFQQDYEKTRTGEKATGLRNDVDAWWVKAKETAGANLDPASRQLVGRALQQSYLTAMAGAGHFENAQLEAATDASWKGAKSTTISQAASNPLVTVDGRGPAGEPITLSAAEAAAADLRDKNNEYAARKGLPKAALDAMNLADTTTLHTQALQTIALSGAPNAGPAAQAYFEKHKDQIDGTKQAELEQMVRKTTSLGEAQTVGAQLAAQFGYTQTGAALKAIDALNVSPEQKKAIRDELEHRHAVQQSDADKNNALLVGKLDTMVQQGMSLAAIQRTPEFLAVRDQGTVLKLVRERQEHAVNLQAAVESRDWTRAQRLREQQTQNGQAAMFAYMDPVTLTSMSRVQVAGLQLQLGAENTAKLLSRFDELKKSDAKLREAKIDQDQFNSLARSVGLDPFNANTPDRKAALANAKDRVEAAIADWQTKHGTEMPREEKGELMRREAAIQVTVAGKWWGSDQLNLLTVPETDIGRVQVPSDHRDQIIARARAETKDPKFMPTDEQIGRAYLLAKQRQATHGQ